MYIRPMPMVEGPYIRLMPKVEGQYVYQAHAKGGGSVCISGPCQRRVCMYIRPMPKVEGLYVYQAHANGAAGSKLLYISC